MRVQLYCRAFLIGGLALSGCREVGGPYPGEDSPNSTAPDETDTEADSEDASSDEGTGDSGDTQSAVGLGEPESKPESKPGSAMKSHGVEGNTPRSAPARPGP